MKKEFVGTVKNMYDLLKEKGTRTINIYDENDLSLATKFHSLLTKTNLLIDKVTMTVIDEDWVYCMVHLGTNGRENSIKNSLLTVATTISILSDFDEVDTISLSDVHCDNLDDIYDFVLVAHLKDFTV